MKNNLPLLLFLLPLLIGAQVEFDMEESLPYTPGISIQNTCSKVNHTNDDAEELYNGTMLITSIDLELVDAGVEQAIGIRFRDLKIPPAAQIKSAVIQFSVFEAENLNPCELFIQGELGKQVPSFFPEAGNITNRKRTNTKILWEPQEWSQKKSFNYKSPNIASLIQEIIDQKTYQFNNPIVLIISGKGRRTAASFDYNAQLAPMLCVEFETTTNPDLEQCPDGLILGMPCDDNDPETIQDQIQADCLCAGIKKTEVDTFYNRVPNPAINNSDEEDYQLKIFHKEDEIQIDGLLNEMTWEKAVVASNFWMHYPKDDRAASLNTEVRMTFDDHFLYVSAICEDQDGGFVHTLKRDANFWRGDGFGVLLDPINKKSNGFLFGVNPWGVQMEALVLKEGRTTDKNWDNYWQSKVKKYKDHWVLEMAIPLKILRYASAETVWGINFIRSEMSDNSYASWVPVPVQFTKTNLAFTGTLVWEKAPKQYRKNVALIPYLTNTVAKNFEARTPKEWTTNAGFNAKVAVGDALNLDLMLNPDFSQVEADDQIINLSRFNIRLPEKRLFFLENRDVFENFSSSRVRPFFSRRIGIDARRNPVPILYGLRLTGNLTQKLRIGAMNIQTEGTAQQLAQNYTATAFHQRIFSRSTFKGFLMNRQAFEGTQFAENDFGRNAGLEFDLRSKNNHWGGQVAYNHSFKANIRSKNDYYKIGGRYRSKHLSAFINWYEVQDNYFLDMGFLRSIEHYDAERDTTIRVGYASLYQEITLNFYPKQKRAYNLHRVRFSNQLILTATEKEFMERHLALSYTVKFPGERRLSTSFKSDQIRLLFPFAFANDKVLPAIEYENNRVELNYQSDRRNTFYWSTMLRYGSFYTGTRWRFKHSISLRLRPWADLGLKMEYNRLRFDVGQPARQILSVSPKLEVNFSNNLFWTTFVQYNTQAENLNINSRLQWRFAPVSDLYLVYSDNYFAPNNDFDDTFSFVGFGPKNRTFVLKLNYWIALPAFSKLK